MALLVGPWRGYEEVGETAYLEFIGVEVAGKNVYKWVFFPGNFLLYSPAVYFPDRMEGLVILMSLGREVLVHFYKMLGGNIVISVRGVLFPARWKRGITGFTGLCGFNSLAQQPHRSLRL